MGKLNFDHFYRDGPTVVDNISKVPSVKKTYAAHYRRIRRSSMKPYDTWKQGFIQDRCCSEKDFIEELVISSIPHVLLNIVLIAYLLFGTVLLQYVDEGVRKEDFPSALLFIFTTLVTIGYGNIYPTTDIGKVCCIAYCVIGIPLIFLVLSNNGQFLVDAYWVMRKSCGGKQSAVSKGLPLWLSVMLLCLHSLVGGLIFSAWLRQMRFIDGVYCSFISVSTIGYGDLVPIPETWTHCVAIIAFLSLGVVILSTLFDTFGCYLQYVHYIGRQFHGTKDVEIWFGGKVLTVKELITLVADQFGVCPRRLRTILRDLDDILEAACDDTVKNRSESLYKAGEAIRNESRVIVKKNGERCTVLVTRDQTSDPDVETTPLYRISSNPNMQKLIVRDTENALQALRVIHQKLNKSTPLLSLREQRDRRQLDTRQLTV